MSYNKFMYYDVLHTVTYEHEKRYKKNEKKRKLEWFYLTRETVNNTYK